MNFDPNLPLELLNGAGMVLEGVFLTLMLIYLWRETHRRGLTWRAWFGGLPPSMHFAVAVIVFDGGVLVRTAAVWVWRRFYGAGDFGAWFLAAIGLATLLIVVGSLCKIRAISRPDYGDGPWLLAVAAVMAFLLGSLYFR
jgi:hypothetical protein